MARPDQAMDPEMLFETRTIPDIAQFSRSLKQDIDRKREELRTMVGERYRDLMEAADTITNMKESSENVISSLESVINQGAEIHSKALLGFSSGKLKNHLNITDDPNQPYLAVAAEIKLLMMAPEKIWTAVEQQDFLLAAQLYLFARHIHTNLTLMESNSLMMSASMTSSTSICNETNSAGRIVSSHFPVVSRQWGSIAHFYEAILQGCQDTMEKAGDDDESRRAGRSMAALVLLRGLSAEDVLEEFLSLRSKSLVNQLKHDKQSETARTLVENSLALLRSTVGIAYQAFMDSEGENLLKILKDCDIPTLSLYETRLSPVFRHLPAIVGDFTPTVAQPLSELKTEFLQAKVMAWLDGIHGQLTQETASVLENVNSIPALSSIRRHCYEMLLQPKHGSLLDATKWNTVCQKMLNRELSLWNEFYRQIFRDKMESLARTQIAGSIYCVQSSLASSSTEKDAFASETDLSQHLWSDLNLTDMTLLPKFGEALNPGSRTGSMNRSTGLELKAMGFSPRVQELCQQFDVVLNKLVQDLVQFMNERENLSHKHGDSKGDTVLQFLSDEKDAERKEPFDLDGDNACILQHVQESVVDHVQKLIDHISDKYLQNSLLSRGMLIFLARFFQAIPELCPALAKCVLAPQTLRPQLEENTFASLQQRRLASAKQDPVWLGVKKRVEHESIKTYNLWIDSLAQDLSWQLSETLKDDPVTLLKILPAWDIIEISEEGDSGDKVKSKIKVPQHISVALACGLAGYSSQVYNVAPFSLPTPVQLSVSQQPAQVICDAYEKVSERESVIQMVALQLYFDMLFLSQCVINRDNKELLQQCQRVLSNLEGHIDPFDFSVFSPHLTANAKKCVLRESGLFSVLIPNDRFALLASLKSSLTSSNPTPSWQQEQHNAVWTFSHKPDKIPLIPIPRKRKSELDNRKKIRTSLAGSANVLTARSSTTMSSSLSPVMGRKKRDKSPVARAAGSFFEAMSTSWFGGKST